MATATGYHRPSDLSSAIALLTRPAPRSIPLAGGTLVNTPLIEGEFEVIDLQALGLDGVDVADATATIGATATLDRLADDDRLPVLIRQLARREMPSTLRTSATVGGTIAARDPESELLATLLVHDAVVTVADVNGERVVPLPQLLLDPRSLDGALITAVRIATDGVAAVDRTARTPADTAIVAAIARRSIDGRVRLALTGVAATPVLIHGDTELHPPGDFRGTSEYRSAVAKILADRVRQAVAA